jgi:hypothetical protein
MEGRPKRSPGGLSAPHQHPAWAQLALPESDSLAWRRAACRDRAATGTTEQERGGILRLLQAVDSPHQLAVPQGTRGALNAYIHSTSELSAAVRAHLRTTRDPFYSRAPEINVNYGGKGASQQLWWCGQAGWKVTQPNRQLLKFLRTEERDAQSGQQAGGAGKRRRLVDDDAIPDEDIALLPPVEVPARAALSEEEALAMFAELQRKGWETEQGYAAVTPASSELHRNGGIRNSSPVDSLTGGSDTETETETGWSSEAMTDSSDSCILVPAIELAEDDDDGLPPAIKIDEADCLPPTIRHPLSELDSSNEVFLALESGATHERQQLPVKQQKEFRTPNVGTTRASPSNRPNLAKPPELSPGALRPPPPLNTLQRQNDAAAEDASRRPPPPLNNLQRQSDASAQDDASTTRTRGNRRDSKPEPTTVAAALRAGAGDEANPPPLSPPGAYRNDTKGGDAAVPLQAKFEVPSGALPGQSLKLQVGRRRFEVVLPQDIKEGQQLRVDTSMTPDRAGVAAATDGGGPPPPPRERSGQEMIAVVVASVIGCVGAFAALSVLKSAGVIAGVSLLASALLVGQLNRQLSQRRLDQPLTEDEDGLLALALILAHISVIATAMQIHETFLGSVDGHAAPDDDIGYVEGSLPLFCCQLLFHMVLGIVQARLLTGMGTRYGGGIAAETPHGGYLCWLALSLLPIAVQTAGFVYWEGHTCERLYAAPEATDPSFPSMKCLDDIGDFFRYSGGFLLVLSVSASQASNRGSLAVAILPMSAFFLLIWAADIGRGTAMGCHAGADCSSRVTPLLILPLLAVYLSGVNLFIRSKSKWTEATTTSLAFSILFCQLVAATTGGMDLLLLGAVTEDISVMDALDHNTGSLSNERFSDAALPLWLTQFVFIPVILLDRAALPILALVLGSGLFGGDLVMVTLPVAAAIGAAVIRLTPVPADGIYDTSSWRWVLGKSGSVEIAPEGDEGPDNRSRAAVCLGLTPCLAAVYVTSSWGVALHSSSNSSDISESDAHVHEYDSSAIQLSAVAIFAPILLGCSHLAFHGIHSSIAYSSMAVAVFLSAGAWLDESLTGACLAICVPVLLGHSNFCRKSDDSDTELHQAKKQSVTDIVHMVCSLALFCFTCFHCLTWQHSWACLCLLYMLCWVPLSVSVSQLGGKTRATRQNVLPAPLTRTRIWRPGLLGPLCCTVPSTFWTVEEGGMICDTQSLRAEAEPCTENSGWMFLLAVPITMVLLEWGATELSVMRCGAPRWSPVSTMQRARTSAILLIAASALPFRVWLHVAQTRGIEAMVDNCTDTGMEGHYTRGHVDWCSFMALDVPARKTAGAMFTAIIAAACVLLYILCGVLGHKSSLDTNRRPVPPTQGMAAALLFLACLDYYTPILAIPLVLAASYTSYTSHWLSAHEGSWPTALLAAPLVWLAKSGIGAWSEIEQANWGAQIFGISPSADLATFVDGFNYWWTPFMGLVLLMWGVWVRLHLVPKWPDDTGAKNGIFF